MRGLLTAGQHPCDSRIYAAPSGVTAATGCDLDLLRYVGSLGDRRSGNATALPHPEVEEYNRATGRFLTKKSRMVS